MLLYIWSVLNLISLAKAHRPYASQTIAFVIQSATPAQTAALTSGWEGIFGQGMRCTVRSTPNRGTKVLVVLLKQPSPLVTESTAPLLLQLLLCLNIHLIWPGSRPWDEVWRWTLANHMADDPLLTPPPLPIHVSITQYYGSHFCLLYNDIRSFGFVLDEVKPLHSVQVNPALMFHSCHEQTDITTGLLTDLAGLLFLTEDLDNGFNPLTEQRDHNFTSTACLIKMALHCRCSLQCGWVQVFTCRSILALVCFHWMCVFDREMGRSSYTKSPLGLLYVCKWNWWEKKMKRKKHKCCGAVLILTREIYSFTISFVIVFNDVNHYKIFSQDI